MERLRAKDKEEGVPEPAPLTAAQKEEIARLRHESKAKLAEMEILHRKDRQAAGGDPQKLAELERKFRIDRERVESRLDSAIENARRGKPAR
jgi:hypothetical protein